MFAKPRQFSVCRIKQEIIFNWVTEQVKRTQCQKLVLAYSLVLNKRDVLNVRFRRKTRNPSSQSDLALEERSGVE